MGRTLTLSSISPNLLYLSLEYESLGAFYVGSRIKREHAPPHVGRRCRDNIDASYPTSDEARLILGLANLTLAAVRQSGLNN